MGEHDYLPVSAVAEIAYCPRNFYYRMVEQLDDANVHTLRGRLEEEKRKARKLVHREHGRQIRSVFASSDRLGIIAVVDAIEEGDELVPYEYKSGPLRHNEWDDIQLCAEAMILEEVTARRISRGWIYYTGSRRRRQVTFTPQLRRRVMQCLRRAWEILDSGEIPPPLASERCRGCALEPSCLPVEVRALKRKGPPPKRPLPGINLGRVVYVDEPGAYVRKSKGRIIVTVKGKTLAEVPAASVDQIVLVAGANLSAPAARFALRANIDVVFLSSYGRFEGRLSSEMHKNVILREAQYKAHFDPARSLELARAFVAGKIHNMRVLVMRQNRKRKLPQLASAAKELRALLRALARAGDRNALMGVEGAATKTYFSAFAQMIEPPDAPFDFDKRTRRPPRDPVNALLSFAYSMLIADLTSATSLVGLDPYVGFLHTAVYGRPALALDLAEEFRPVIADSVVLSLVNQGMVSESHFYQRLGGWFLTERGRERFFTALNARRKQEVTHPIFGYKLSYLRTMELQTRLLAKVLTGELNEYVPFKVR